MFKTIIGILAVAVIAIIGFLVIDPNLSNNNSYYLSYVSEDLFKVSIEGEVVKEGTYTLKEGTLMSDLIDAAGGVNDNADQFAYFLDAELENGMTYFIASKYDEKNICSDKELEKVNINSDDSEKLASVNGISSSIANSIISYRNEKGIFKTIEQLLDVYGIGNATYTKIRNYVTLHL